MTPSPPIRLKLHLHHLTTIPTPRLPTSAYPAPPENIHTFSILPLPSKKKNSKNSNKNRREHLSATSTSFLLLRV
ncbi:predicted protein [Plenodomus lingam JN3]|uniref:Predicted protein n=1 Tax=Leptosphaeria maculans (strain JN3 / isolate v23.1.3 / race Av1-4-5-6-7-8) TaxID=985895 RepID=E4ZT17_LEPMJ|nr:predicted protein [Plenodomus lingam JN3]CBX94448.1 predicted protein [Plenodomus lingam JN3]